MIVFCLPLAAVLYVATTLLNEKVNKIVSDIVIMLLYVIFFAQMVYFQVYNSVFSVYSMTNGGQVFEFWRTILSTVVSNLYNYICLTIPVILYFIFRNKLFDYSKNNLLVTGISFACFLLLSSISFAYVGIDRKDIYSSYNLSLSSSINLLSSIPLLFIALSPSSQLTYSYSDLKPFRLYPHRIR